MTGLPETKEQWIVLIAYALIDFLLGKNQVLRPNSIPEVVQYGLNMVFGRFFKRSSYDVISTVGQSCPHCGSKI